MAESKLLDEDKDEWFYQTMNKYSNLYMFELEFPLDTLEIINESSLCISGLQTFSKKCELLQLCVPPKLLRSEDEGLCKDRDFKILSGGYADGRIRQMNAVKKSTNLIATQQDGFNGVVIYEVGDDNRATIMEKHRLSTSKPVSGKGKPLCCLNDGILLATDPKDEETASLDRDGILVNEWKFDGGLSESHSSPSTSHHLWKNSSDFKCGHVEKIKAWDDNHTCIFLTSYGTVGIHDLRTGNETPSIFFHASKSSNNHVAPSSSSLSSTPIVFTFDCLPEANKIGILDSCGGYETFDPRFVNESGGNASEAKSSSSTNRCLLPEFSDLTGLYPAWFNIEYEGRTKMRENEMTSRFIISGLKRECVPVFQEASLNLNSSLIEDNNSITPVNIVDKKKDTGGGGSVEPVFSHDGHSKPVSHSIWHPVAKDLIFSASLDAVLHAWQFIPDK